MRLESVDAPIPVRPAERPGLPPEAESVLRGAERTSPDSVVVLNNLAQTLSDQGRDAEALPIIERAVALGGPFASSVEETRKTIRQRLQKK